MIKAIKKEYSFINIILLVLLTNKIISDKYFFNPTESLFKSYNKLNNNDKLKILNNINRYQLLNEMLNSPINLSFRFDSQTKLKIFVKYQIMLYIQLLCSPPKNQNTIINNEADKLINQSNKITNYDNLIIDEKTLLNDKFIIKNDIDFVKEIKRKIFPKIKYIKKKSRLNKIKKDFLYEKIKLYNIKYKENIEKFKYLDSLYSILIVTICCAFKFLTNPQIISRRKKIPNFINNKKKYKLVRNILNASCVICLENLISEKQNNITENKIMILECNHIFHKICIIRWLKDHNNCPLCRIDFLFNEKNNRIIRIY